MKTAKFVVEIQYADKDACGNVVNPPNEYEVRTAVAKGVDYADAVNVTALPVLYSDLELAPEDKVKEDKANADAGWGVDIDSQIARWHLGNDYTKALVIYRLHDANFHTIADLLDRGDWKGAMAKAKEYQD